PRPPKNCTVKLDGRNAMIVRMADRKRAAFSPGNAALFIVGGQRTLAWSKFFSWLNWYATRCRRWRGAGTARVFSARRAAGVAARVAWLREAGVKDSC